MVPVTSLRPLIVVSVLSWICGSLYAQGQNALADDDHKRPGKRPAVANENKSKPFAARKPRTGPMLMQDGNPVNSALNNYKGLLSGDLEKDQQIAASMVAYQLPHGGFQKERLTRYAKGIPTADQVAADHTNARFLGSIDNDSSTTEIAFLADVYKRSIERGDAAGQYKTAAQRTLGYFLQMQSETGGFPQFFPSRGPTSYSNHATFNDDATIRVLTVMQRAVRKQAPFDSGIFSAEQLKQTETAIEYGVDFILNSQIETEGIKTVWCAQHGMRDYQPKIARSYELPSKSGGESTLVCAFLMSRPQSTDVELAVKSALAWFRSPKTFLADHIYDKRQTGAGKSPIVTKAGSRMWYRFYSLDSNEPMFVNRDGTVFRDIKLMNVERKDGYRWGGDWPEKLLSYAKSVGY